MHGEVAGEWAELFLLKLNDERVWISTSDDATKIFRRSIERFAFIIPGERNKFPQPRS